MQHTLYLYTRHTHSHLLTDEQLKRPRVILVIIELRLLRLLRVRRRALRLGRRRRVRVGVVLQARAVSLT